MPCSSRQSRQVGSVWKGDSGSAPLAPEPNEMGVGRCAKEAVNVVEGLPEYCTCSLL